MCKFSEGTAGGSKVSVFLRTNTLPAGVIVIGISENIFLSVEGW